MEWKRAMEEERAALGRIVTLLVALAGLAENAVGRSAIVRGFVLWLLRHAEAVVRDFVACDTDPASTAMPVLPAGNTPTDALRLAASLRALAGQIDREARMLALCGPEDFEPAGSPCPWPAPTIATVWDRLSAIVAASPCRALRVLAPDTS